MVRNRDRALLGGLVVLTIGLAANAILGPLFLGVIDYRYGESMTNQGIGLDAVALFVVAPAALMAAWLVRRQHLAGPPVAFLPAAFAAYMAPQYVIGPAYEQLPGNNERFFLLHLGLLLVGIAVLLLAWQAVDRIHLLPATRASDRRRSWVLVGAAVFVLLRWLPSLPELVQGAPTSPEYLDNPTAFMLIALLDLALVVPATLTAALGLRAGALWGRAAAYAVLGFFAVVPLAVAAMAVTMVLRGDPNGSVGTAVGFSGAAIVFGLLALLLYRPLGEQRIVTVPEAWTRAHRLGHRDA